jgi:hypothetical protein
MVNDSKLALDIFKWLLIGRCDVRHVSYASQHGSAGVGRASGKIGAIMFLKPLRFFRYGDLDQKKLLETCQA